MLKVRVIPTMLWKDFGLVKGVAFNSWRRVGSVMPGIKVYNARDVDELILVDISATNDRFSPDHESILDFSEECFVPLTVGGGVKTKSDILNLLHAGADKVSINTEAYENPDIIESAASRFGSQCVVASIDVKLLSDGSYRCFSHSGTVDTGKDPEVWAKELVDRGVGEILLTSIDKDGTMDGYDLKLTEQLANSVSVPIIASGGAGCYQDMIDVVLKSGASAVAAASIFHFTELTPAGAKEAMQLAGIPIRQNYIKSH